tara:strand:+ start:324 stop:668 length:345 start_codon:yes stop_codon:yes gene_type:complete
MSEFFQSEVVRAAMAELSELQEEVYKNVFKFPTMSIKDKAYHIDILEKLMEKQQVMYARLSLSNDPEAQQMKKQIEQSAITMGLPKNVDMNAVFKDMSRMIDLMRSHIDKELES